MASGSTTRKKIQFPKPSDADKICSDWESTAKTIDELNDLRTAWLQAGVVESSDWSFTANINSGTGALGSTGNTGGKAFLPDPVVSNDLMPSITSSATLSGIAPSLLPASGKYVSCAFELTPSTWAAAATVSAHSGVEKATEAEAIAAPPATTAGKIQVRRVIIHNTAGVYSITAQEDVRPWATGADWRAVFSGSQAFSEGAPKEVVLGEAVKQRLAISTSSGVILTVSIEAKASKPNEQLLVEWYRDGVKYGSGGIFTFGSAPKTLRFNVMAPNGPGGWPASSMWVLKGSNVSEIPETITLTSVAVRIQEVSGTSRSNGTS